MAKNPFLYFDIETGDLSAKNSPVLSISYSRGDEKKSLYARAPEGSFISDWSKENVQKPIAARLGGEPTHTEEQILREFLGVVQGHRGGTVAGWNIGYTPVAQAEGVKGLDIPFLISRAEKYGMGKEYQQAFGGVKIRDIGREFSVRIASEVTKYPELVDPHLHAQARSFSELIEKNIATHRLNTVPEKAAFMGGSGGHHGYEVAGWKLKDIYHRMFGTGFAGHHLSDADVAATRRIAENTDFSSITGPAFVADWNKTALLRKAESAARTRGVGTGGLGKEFARRAAARFGTPVGVAGRVLAEHKWGIGIGVGIAGLLALNPLSLFSGKDDEYNTIEGLPHGGMAEKKRRELTTFGSGHKGEEHSVVPGVIGAGIGAAGGYAAMYPWTVSKIRLTDYPRLAKLRKVGSSYGMKIISSSMASAIGGEEYNRRSRFHKFVGHALFGEIQPVRSIEDVRDFKGVAYYHGASAIRADRPLTPLMTNWGDWDIGVDKLKTWDYMKARKAEGFYAETLAASEFYEGSGKGARLSVAGRKFIEEAGGVHNLVVKRNVSSLGEGVWTDASKLPRDVAEEMVRNPGEFHLQKRLELANEFRVITAGDKAVYTAHRFGTPGFKRFGNWLSKHLPGIPGIGKLRWSENIQPVLDRETHSKLTAFAEQASRHLPYEIGAFDIGMTKQGVFKIIEAQRSFGSISNPVVSRRIRNVITGKAGMGGVAAGIIGAGMGLALAGILFGKDDAHNTIEGLRHEGEAGRNRSRRTDFGSGFTRRAWNVFKTFWNEGNRSIAHTVNHLLIPGAKSGGPLELGVLGITGAEIAHTASSALAGGLGPLGIAASAATFVGSKYAYLALKKRGAIRTAAALAKENPAEAMLLTKTVAKTSWRQATDYLFKGVQNEFSVFAKFGGGDLGRQALIGSMEAKYGVQFSGKDDVYNLLEGLRHGGMAEQLRKSLTDFGSGWIRRAIKMGISSEKIAAGVVQAGEGLESSSFALASRTKELLKAGDTDTLVKYLRANQGVTIGGQRFVFGKTLGEGGFGKAVEAFATGGPRRGEKLVFKHMKEVADISNLPKGAAVMGPGFGVSFGKLQEKVGSLIQRGQEIPLELQGQKQRFGSFIEEYMGAIKKSNAPYGGKLDAAYEAAMQSKARTMYGDMVPEVIGHNQSGILMEHAGSPLPMEYKKNVLGFIDKTWNNMMSRTDARIVQFDPHAGQVLRRGARLRTIDWGVSAEVAGEFEHRNLVRDILDDYANEITTPTANTPSSLLESFRPHTPSAPLPLPEPAMLLDREAWLSAHKNGVIMASQNAARGGKAHQSFSKMAKTYIRKPRGKGGTQII